MKRLTEKTYLYCLAILLGLLLAPRESSADPSKYPEYAQQELPKGVQPDFVSLDQLVDDIVKGKKPLMIDVRSREEYDEAHIKAAMSIPLGEVPLHLKEIPKDRPVVLY